VVARYGGVRVIVIVVVGSVARVAAAQPAASEPAALDPPAAPRPACSLCEPRPTVAARIGVSFLADAGRASYALGSDPAPSGAGLLVEVEAGVRTRRYTFAAFANYFAPPTLGSEGATGNVSCVGADAITEDFTSVGGRVRVHFGGGFVGFGVGVERQHKTTTCVATGMAVAVEELHPMADVHAGYNVAKLGPVAFQFFAAITHGDGWDSPWTGRLAIGFVY
jgi:hypothetical protein